MKEKEKLREATYFHSKMIEEQEDRDVFKFNLSAFLSSARSVMQYAVKGSKAKKGGQQWYDNCMVKSLVLEFFKCKRNINIHDEPVHPTAHFHDTITETIYVSNSISIVHKDKDRKIISEYSSEKPKPEPEKQEKQETSIVQEVKYKFSDWPGEEDVITLCEEYIQELEKVLHDGISKGFITE